MKLRRFIPSVTLVFCASLPLATSFAAPAEGEPETRVDDVKLPVLVEGFLAEAAAGKTYECNGKCSKKGGGDEACPAASSPRGQLVALLSKSPEAVASLEPIAVASVRGKGSLENAGALIGVLLEVRAPGAFEVAEAMHEVVPKGFEAGALLSFCEMGSKTLLSPLTDMVKRGQGGVFEAAYLAAKGEKAGKKVLKKAAKVKEVSADNALDVLVAGHALELLGDRDAGLRSRILVHDAAVAALDAGEVESARWMAVTAWTHHAATGTSQTVFSQLPEICETNLKRALKKGELAEADDVFELLERMTPVI